MQYDSPRGEITAALRHRRRRPRPQQADTRPTKRILRPGDGGVRDGGPGGQVRVTLSLDAASVAWAREQPGGLADVMRRLLDDARRGAAATAAAPSSPAGNGGGGGADDAPELRAAYDRLIDRKLRHGLAEGEEHVLADLRARIFALDGEIVDGPAAPAAVYASRK